MSKVSVYMVLAAFVAIFSSFNGAKAEGRENPPSVGVQAVLCWVAPKEPVAKVQCTEAMSFKRALQQAEAIGFTSNENLVGPLVHRQGTPTFQWAVTHQSAN